MLLLFKVSNIPHHPPRPDVLENPPTSLLQSVACLSTHRFIVIMSIIFHSTSRVLLSIIPMSLNHFQTCGGTFPFGSNVSPSSLDILWRCSLSACPFILRVTTCHRDVHEPLECVFALDQSSRKRCRLKHLQWIDWIPALSSPSTRHFIYFLHSFHSFHKIVTLMWRFDHWSNVSMESIRLNVCSSLNVHSAFTLYSSHFHSMSRFYLHYVHLNFILAFEAHFSISLFWSNSFSFPNIPSDWQWPNFDWSTIRVILTNRSHIRIFWHNICNEMHLNRLKHLLLRVPPPLLLLRRRIREFLHRTVRVVINSTHRAMQTMRREQDLLLSRSKALSSPFNKRWIMSFFKQVSSFSPSLRWSFLTKPSSPSASLPLPMENWLLRVEAPWSISFSLRSVAILHSFVSLCACVLYHISSLFFWSSML